jgi:ferritin-like metal-binding protein YciE
VRHTPSKMECVMGLFTKDIKTMDDLLLHGLKDIYYAENQIVKSLPKLIDKATNRELTKGLSDHLEETKNQIARLDQVFKKLGQQPQGVQCPAIDGLISEADDVAGEVADKQVLDAAVIGAAQSVEHYEIARYGTLIAWADELGRDDVVRLLTLILPAAHNAGFARHHRLEAFATSAGGRLFPRSRPSCPACRRGGRTPFRSVPASNTSP